MGPLKLLWTAQVEKPLFNDPYASPSVLEQDTKPQTAPDAASSAPVFKC